MSLTDVMQPPEGDARWRELAAKVVARRLELGRTQQELADLGGPAVPTIRQVERAGVRGQLKRTTVDKFDRCLGWEPGSFERVMNGRGQPTVANDAPFPVEVASTELATLIRQAVADANERTVKLSHSAWAKLAQIANDRDMSISDALESLIEAFSPR